MIAVLAASPAGAGGSGMITLLPLLLIPVLYLMVFRPQQKRQKEWQQMLTALKTGDRITTAGGIRGIILNIKEDAIVIREGQVGPTPENVRLLESEVLPSWLTILSPGFRPEPAPIKTASPKSTGRRSAMANWIASPEHPRLGVGCGRIGL